MNSEIFYAARVLDEAYERLKDAYISTSVLGPVRLYSAAETADREFWALFCALIDYQMPVARLLNPMLLGFVRHIEGRGLKFLDLIYDAKLAEKVLSEFEWSSPKSPREGFTHRFLRIRDLIDLLAAFRGICDSYGSLGSFVKSSYALHRHEPEPMEGVIRDLQRELLNHGGGIAVPRHTDSCMKRFNLFFRWLVRPYPDLGLWGFIDRKHLLASLDANLQRVVSRAFGLKVKLNWRGVLKATGFLRKLNPDDPTKYDYVLSRLSIMGYCAKDLARSKCLLCPIVSVCKASEPPRPVEVGLRTEAETEILKRYLEIYGRELDRVYTEYPLGRFSADALIHKTSCSEYVVEVEEELNYTAIGQVATYRYLFYKIHGRLAKPMIICRRAKSELKEAAWIEQGIEVVEVQ
ncbi:MAG: hypothetical protein DSO00_02240 [Archaeoglobi archaeon]|nr:MAG: hypothetical protein DSO00_02240 [Archaeoglobi archaeon]